MILAAVTGIVTLAVAGVGGIGASSSEPAEVGSLLFQVFFSIAFAAICWIGPGIGALTIASERHGRTWETLQLTALSSQQIARGKFAAAMTYVVMLVCMLAPVGALPFLFGGVTTAEMLIAFVLLLAFSVIAVGFGLVISAAVDSPLVAVLVTIPLATVGSGLTYFGLGLGLSVGASEIWPSITAGSPVWLPAALVRAEFDWLYGWALFYTPAAVFLSVCWFCYELTVSNLAPPNQDRYRGLRRWFVLSIVVLMPVIMLPRAFIPNRNDYLFSSVGGIVATSLYALFGLLVFCGDVVFPESRGGIRNTQARLLGSYLGPGVLKSGLLVCALAAFFIGAIATAGIAQEYDNAAVLGTLERTHVEAIAITSGYAWAFLFGCTGLAVYVRARSRSGTAPRIIVLGLAFAALIGPWLVAAIFGVVSGDASSVMWMAAPSPGFVFFVVDRLVNHGPAAEPLLSTAALAATGWATAGLVLFVLGIRKARATLVPAGQP